METNTYDRGAMIVPVSLFGEFKDGGLESWLVDFPVVWFADA